MKTKSIGTLLMAGLVVLSAMVVFATPAMAIPGQLRLEAIPSTYVDDSEDAWFCESYVTTATSFDLNITNHNGGNIYYLYLLVAVDRDPVGNVTVNVSDITAGPYDGVITDNNKALVSETESDYEYPGHGIYNYKSDVHFNVTNITIPGDGVLSAGETVTVPVEITLLTSPSVPVKVHFDAVGADNNNEAIAFVPPSHDVTHQVPEFATIAIPVASILGLLFFFNHRKRRGGVACDDEKSRR